VGVGAFHSRKIVLIYQGKLREFFCEGLAIPTFKAFHGVWWVGAFHSRKIVLIYQGKLWEFFCEGLAIPTVKAFHGVWWVGAFHSKAHGIIKNNGESPRLMVVRCFI
jgi:hypothetical protein